MCEIGLCTNKNHFIIFKNVLSFAESRTHFALFKQDKDDTGLNVFFETLIIPTYASWVLFLMFLLWWSHFWEAKIYILSSPSYSCQISVEVLFQTNIFLNPVLLSNISHVTVYNHDSYTHLHKCFWFSTSLAICIRLFFLLSQIFISCSFCVSFLILFSFGYELIVIFASNINSDFVLIRDE